VARYPRCNSTARRGTCYKYPLLRKVPFHLDCTVYVKYSNTDHASYFRTALALALALAEKPPHTNMACENGVNEYNPLTDPT